MKTLIQLSNIEKHYGAKSVFEDASAIFTDNMKAGVVGKNGAGKTTLFKLISGEEKADGGSIFKHESLKLAYMEQQPPFLENERVVDFLMRVSGKEEWQCGKVAGKFHLKNELFISEIENLSGGYRMRVKLAALLLSEPNFLFLDEPSNYLDLSTLLHLEKFLLDFSGGYLVISHDRQFIKRICDSTLEVENAKLTVFPGDIEEYLSYKSEMKEQAQKFNKGVEQKKAQLQAFVDKYGAKNTKATQAKSKMKQIDRLKTIGIEGEGKTTNIIIPNVEDKKGFALITNNLSIGYPEKTIASSINIEVTRGSKIAIVGDNGEGKTTFMRTLAGDLEKKSGEYRLGHNISIGYYAQHVYEKFNANESVYSFLERVCPWAVKEEILRMAGCFLFSGDDINKSVSVLSGGERARLCLASILLKKNDMLFLDEPTNHLDFETVEALAIALKRFNGTILFISHDRTFVNIAAESIIEVGGGKVNLYTEPYEVYLSRLEEETEEDYSSGDKDEQLKEESTGAVAYKAQKEAKVLLNKLKIEAKNSEKSVEKLTAEKEEILRSFEENPLADEKRSRRLKEIETLIEDTENRWMEILEEIDSLS